MTSAVVRMEAFCPHHSGSVNSEEEMHAKSQDSVFVPEDYERLRDCCLDNVMGHPGTIRSP